MLVSGSSIAAVKEKVEKPAISTYTPEPRVAHVVGAPCTGEYRRVGHVGVRERAEGTWSVAGGVAHHRDLPPSLGVFVEVLDHLRGAARAARVKLPPLGQASGAPVSPPPPHRLSAPSWRPLPSPLRCLSASPAGPAGLDPPPSRSGQRRTPSAAPPPRAAAGGTYPPNTAEQVSRGGRACGGGAAGPPPARTARPASRYRLRRWWCRSRRTPPPALQCLRCACGPTRRAAAASGCRA